MSNNTKISFREQWDQCNEVWGKGFGVSGASKTMTLWYNEVLNELKLWPGTASLVLTYYGWECIGEFD